MPRRLRFEAEIDAPPERVWELLTDFASFPRWNPFIRKASGRVAVGQQLDIQLRLYSWGLTRFRPVVTVAKPGQELRWLATMIRPGVFDVDRYFVLEPLEGGRTRFIQGENCSGPLAPILLGSGLDRRILRGYRRFAKALKRRAQRVPGNPGEPVPLRPVPN